MRTDTRVAGIRTARLYAHAGQNDLTLAWLKTAVDANETPTAHLAVAWDWDALRPDPRFHASQPAEPHHRDEKKERLP